MSVFSANSDIRSRPFPPGAMARRPSRPSQGNQLVPVRPRQRAATRQIRRLEAASQRAEDRLTSLGPSWHVVEWPHGPLLPEPDPRHPREPDRAGFLAFGPGGVYAICVVDQGRQRVMLAGDVVQIQGRRPTYIQDARRDARRASGALSAAVGTKVPVVAILTFVGSGPISAHGLPNGCLVVSHQELDTLLLAAGNRISGLTARKLADVASHPTTWSDHYRWYADGQTVGDRTALRR